MGKAIEAKDLNIYYGSFRAVEGVNMLIRPKTGGACPAFAKVCSMRPVLKMPLLQADAAAVMTVVQEYAFKCTLSIGIASALPGMNDVTDWLKAADDALYQAKRLGKNQIYSH